MKHGHTRGGRVTPTYQAWLNMRSRCYNHNTKYYARYGGRGIRVCERWREFSNFLEDMGEVPTGLELDRIDNNGNYAPNNCRWATRKEQLRNRNYCHMLTYNGKTMNLAAWAEELGLDYHLLQMRLWAGNWTVERMLTTPKQSKSDPRLRVKGKPARR